MPMAQRLMSVARAVAQHKRHVRREAHECRAALALVYAGAGARHVGVTALNFAFAELRFIAGAKTNCVSDLGDGGGEPFE